MRHPVTRTVALTLIGTAVLTLILSLALGDGWLSAWVAATAVGVAATAITLPMLLGALKLEPMLAGPRVLAAGGLRAALVLGGAVVAYKGFGLAKVPTFALTLAYYAALLTAETWTVSQALVTPETPADPTNDA